MIEKEFTDEEKAAVAYFLHRKPSKREAISDYAIYVVPSLLFAVYSIWAHDFIAALIAYGSLLFVVIWYLSHTEKISGPLYSAVNKYEQISNKLTKNEELKNE
jgi:hypothetical protein